MGDALSMPMLVYRDYELPPWTQPDRAVLCSSYSGETEETLAAFEKQLRASAGPPAAYDAGKFGDGNIYYGPALMWQELRERIGDDSFFQVLREWPASQENGNADRHEYWAWIEKTTGEELTSFFEDWLLGEQTPQR